MATEHQGRVELSQGIEALGEFVPIDPCQPGAVDGLPEPLAIGQLVRGEVGGIGGCRLMRARNVCPGRELMMG